MIDTYTVCFFGHRIIEDFFTVEKILYEMISKLIRTKEYVELLVGENGDCDQIVSSCIRNSKRKIFDANSSLILVLPYETLDYKNNSECYQAYYDEIEIFESENIHYKAIYQARNKSMVDRADLCIFFVNRNSGGAAQTLKYALKQGKNVINISDVLKFRCE